MKRLILLLFMRAQTALFAQEYFPEGTKWTEIRLDTLKYDSWYSKVGDDWVSNFKTIEYEIKGDYINKWAGYHWDKYTCVYSNSSEWKDSLTLLIGESVTEGDTYIGATTPNLVDEFALPGEVYQMEWFIGKELYYRDIIESNITGSITEPLRYGSIEEIKEGVFGGAKPLKYVDLNGVRIIHGIGVTEWKDGECLFGPICIYKYLFYDKEVSPKVRHDRSMLVHFERNGEVLYDIWPEKEMTNGMKSINKNKTPIANTLYDLQGRKIQQEPRKKEIYIQNGKKVIVE